MQNVTIKLIRRSDLVAAIVHIEKWVNDLQNNVMLSYRQFTESFTYHSAHMTKQFAATNPQTKSFFPTTGNGIDGNSNTAGNLEKSTQLKTEDIFADMIRYKFV